MSSKATNKGLTRLVECSVCYENYNEHNRLPKLLPCGHTLCLSCVQKITGEVSGNVVCSSCRAVFDVPGGDCNGFPNDLTMIQALSMLGCGQNTQPPPRPPKPAQNVTSVDEQLDMLRWKLTDLRCQCQLTSYSMKEFVEKCAYMRNQVKACFDRLRQRIDQREASLLKKIENMDSNLVQNNSQLEVNKADDFIECTEKKMSSLCQVDQIKQLIKTCDECLSRLHVLYRQQMSNDRKMVFIETRFEEACKCVDEVGSFDDSLMYEDMSLCSDNRRKPPPLPIRPSHLSTGGAAYLGPQLVLDSPVAETEPLEITSDYQLPQNSRPQNRYEPFTTPRATATHPYEDDGQQLRRPRRSSLPSPTINQITIACQSTMQVFNPNMFNSPTSSATTGDIDTTQYSQQIERVSLSATQRCLGEKYFRHGRLFIGGPSGVAITEGRSIVVADKGNNCIRVFNEIGTHIRSFRYDRGRYPLKCPLGVVTNSQKKVLVVDGYSRVHVFDWSGQYVLGFCCKQLADSGQARTTLIGIAIGLNWNIYIVDPDDHCINIYNIDGIVIGRIGDAGQLGKPKGLCLRGDLLYVTDKSSNNIKIFSAVDGSFIRKVGYGKGNGPGFLRGPKGIVVDRKGNIIVADYGNNRVQMFDDKGNCVRIIESSSSALKEPEDVAVFRDGRIVVSDGGNERLIMI